MQALAGISQTKFPKVLLDNLPVIVFEINKEGIFTELLGSGLELFELVDIESLGKCVFDLYPDVKDELQQAFKGESHKFVVNPIIRQKRMFFEVSMFPDLSKPGAVMGFILNITQQKNSDYELEKAKLALERTVDLLNTGEEINKTGGWEYDVIKDVVYRSKNMNLLLGISEESTSLYDAIDLYEEKDAGIIKQAMSDAIMQQMPYDIELTPRGTNKCFKSIGIPVAKDGRTIKVVGAIIDITERKQAETELLKAKQLAEEAALAKQQFLLSMSHEIRTPMNAIIGLTHLLLQESPGQEQLQYLNVLKLSGEKLLSVINDVLDYSKIASGKVVFEETDFNLAELVNHVKQTHLISAEGKGLKFKIKMDSDLPKVINGDPIRLTQILNNLVSNAIKFTASGSVIVDLTLNEITDDMVNVSFSVTDTGIGIEPDLMDYIFESFTQVNADTTRTFGGTGLGLAITKRLLTLQESDIYVESEPGKGAVFGFSLKFKIGTKVTTGPLADFLALAGYRVLLAEDNEINVLVASRFIKKWGLEMDCAGTGTEAFEKVRDNQYDLVLMDLEMPKMDGYEASRMIRNIPGEKFKQLPIIALTASVLSEVNTKVIDAGMNDYVAKPFDPTELYNKMVYHLVQA
jgi:signal transduction histidine kinase